MIKQKTIKENISFSGFGVHSGRASKIILKTGKVNSGIRFFLDRQIIDLSINNIIVSPLCTTISKNNVSVSTVEHLLSAINGLDVTNIEIHVQGKEIPIMDGCTSEFVKKIFPFLDEQNKASEQINIKQNIIYRSNEKIIIAIPNKSLEINYVIDYNNKLPYFMAYNYKHCTENYINEISKARTFGYLEDLESLRKNGLALGSSTENTLVISNNSYLNNLNYYNEPVRHKILDFIGDLAFLNKKLNAKIFAYKTGHKEHLEFVKLFKNL